MSFRKFQEYKLLREQEEGKSGDKKSKGDDPLQSKIILGDGNEYEPLMVSDDPNSEHYGKNKDLAPLIRAFKKGANWGWSKDDASGDDKPVKIGGKKLYLTGGSVRRHLKGEKLGDTVQLATNSSPDEVYHVLRQNGFDFVENPEQAPKKGSFFWVEDKDKGGRPFTFGVKVNNSQFKLDIFRKTPRGMVDMQPQSGSHSDDAAGRDFTMNAMSILLGSDNGPNKELHDFYGGAHDLASGRVRCIGDMAKKFSEDPSRMLRFVRMVNAYGDPKNISADDKAKIQKMGKGLGKLGPDVIMGEFKKGLDRDGCDARKYLNLFKDLGMLDQMFPGKMLDTKFPKELSEIGDKHMPLAWMLRMNDPADLADTGMPPGMLKKLAFFIQSLGLREDIDEDELDNLTNGYRSSGVSARKLKEWGRKLGKLDERLIDAFIQHVKSPRVTMMVPDDSGQEVVHDAFTDLVDPFQGPMSNEFVDDRKRKLELMNFQRILQHAIPQ